LSLKKKHLKIHQGMAILHCIINTWRNERMISFFAASWSGWSFGRDSNQGRKL